MNQSPFDPTLVNVQLVTDTESASNFLHWVANENGPLMGFDVETDGLDWFDGELRLVQFGNLFEGWAIPFQSWRELVAEALRIIFARRQHVVGHNVKFDLHWAERHVRGFKVTDWSLIHDTMLLAGVCDSSGTKALKDLAEYYVHPLAKVGQNALKADMKKGNWTWGTVPTDLPSYWVYGVLDTILTVNLFYVLLDKAQKSGCMGAYAVERGAMPGLFAQERKGLLVDSEYCSLQQEILLRRCAEIEQEVTVFGIDNITSLPQMALAFERSGVTLVDTTATGKWAMNQDAFEGIVARNGEHPLVTLIHDHRQNVKMANSYYANFLKFQRSDGRVHPMYRQMQAKTGRMSCTDPAMQTLPRSDDDAPEAARIVRNAFVAEQGHVLLSTDFANVEARIFAHYAQEHGMLEAIRTGVNLHKYTASRIFNRPIESIDKKDTIYTVAKNTLFCTIYGGGPAKIAQTAGVSLAEGTAASLGLHAAFPGIKAFQRLCTQMGTDNLQQYGKAFIRGIDGRILSMVDSDDRYYAFTNWLIQSTAAVVLKQRLAAIDAMGLTDYCVATIHDEIVAEIPAEDEEDFKVAIVEAMNDLHSFSVEIIAEPGKGAMRLGDAK